MSAVKVLKCQLFNDTVKKLEGAKNGDRALRALGEFIKLKTENPTAPFDGSDKMNPPGTPMAKAVPKIKHAHLTSNISIFYTLGGSNPIELRLYGVFTHDDAGMGTAGNVKVQNGVAKQMSRQEFS